MELKDPSIQRGCWCGVCGRAHRLEMTGEEFRSCVSAVKNAINGNGCLIIECDDCTKARREKIDEGTEAGRPDYLLGLSHSER